MLKRYLRPLLSGSMLGLMLAFPQQAADAALQALRVFAQSVLPSLFPFTACMLLFTAGRTLPLPPLVALAYLGGSPAGARLFQDAQLDRRCSRRMAATTGVMSPMFFLSTLSSWLDNPAAGRMLLLCHMSAALVCALFFRAKTSGTKITLPPLSVSAALANACSAMLTVGACIVLGTVSARMAACLFPALSALPLAIFQCLLEVTSGCKSLTAFSLSPMLLLPLLCAATSFGGLSILLQNAAFWGKHHISLWQLVIFAILRAAIAFILCLAFLLCLPAQFAL